MGVLSKSGNWVVAKTGESMKYTKDTTVTEITKYKNQIEGLIQKVPFPNCTLVKAVFAQIHALLDQIQGLSSVGWCKERLYEMYCRVYDLFEVLHSHLKPTLVYPVQLVVEDISSAQKVLFTFICDTFGKFDDRLVTPVYDKCYDISSFTVTFTKDNIIIPVNQCVQSTVVQPTMNCVNYTYDTTTSKALSMANFVKSTSISSIAYIDKRLSLVDLLAQVAQRSLDAGKKVDGCITGSKIENKVVKPAFNKAYNKVVDLDSNLLGGKVKSFVEDTTEEFYCARDGDQKQKQSTSGVLTIKDNRTSAGPPVAKARRGPQ